MRTASIGDNKLVQKKKTSPARGLFHIRQIVCKPGSVEIGHLSRPAVASRLKRVHIGLAGTNGLLQQGPFLAADRVYLCCTSPCTTVGFYPTRFIFALRYTQGSFVSVALSLGLPPVAVSDCPSLCCPDFPPRIATRRPTNNLTKVL